MMDQIQVGAIGDSIMAGSPWDDDPAIGWPAAAAESDPRLRFTVRAVYGKRTDEIAAWLDDAAEGAAALVVQGGMSWACASPSPTFCRGTTAGRMPSRRSAS